MSDWAAIEGEYIRSCLSYKEIAQKFGVSYAEVVKRGREGKWVLKRKKQLGKTQNLAQLTNKLIQTAGRAIDRLEEDVDPQKLKQLVSSVRELRELMKSLPENAREDMQKHEALLNAIREAGNGDS